MIYGLIVNRKKTFPYKSKMFETRAAKSKPVEYRILDEYFNESKPQNSGRFIFVYLRTDPEVIRKRIRKR